MPKVVNYAQFDEKANRGLRSNFFLNHLEKFLSSKSDIGKLSLRLPQNPMVGCLLDSICTKRKDLQCLWGFVGLQYNKKKYFQCLWGSGSLNNNF